MAIRAQILDVFYTAWDTSTNVGKTGDVANHTLRVVKDSGAAAAPTNSPAEVDATNLPGVYRLQLTATEMTANSIAVGGKSSTANISIMPVFITTERGLVTEERVDYRTGVRKKMATPDVGDDITIYQYAADGTTLLGKWHFTIDGSNNLVKTWVSA